MKHKLIEMEDHRGGNQDDLGYGDSFLGAHRRQDPCKKVNVMKMKNF